MITEAQLSSLTVMAGTGTTCGEFRLGRWCMAILRRVYNIHRQIVKDLVAGNDAKWKVKRI